jgi:AcrR family transcriptional regulator
MSKTHADIFSSGSRGADFMPNEEIKLRNVEHTLQVATELLLSNGIEGTTKEMIVKSSGLSRKSIDRYFLDKSDCVMNVAGWIGNNVWNEINERYSMVMLRNSNLTGADALLTYLADLKKIFAKDARLFVFYTDFKIYLSRNSEDYKFEYEKLLDTVGSRYVMKHIFMIGVEDGSLRSDINPDVEPEYFCKSCFSFFGSIALDYKYNSAKAKEEINDYVARMLELYCS